MNLDTHLKEGEQALAHIWKVTALRGALAIAFSVVILIWPNIGLSALIALFGAFALLSGLATTPVHIMGRWRRRSICRRSKWR